MEMEHINENLIKVIIDAEDLEERGITFLDLISGQDYIEEFFYSILEEMNVTEHFKDSDAVTFQVMPKQDGIELYISRQDFDDNNDWEDELTKHLIEHHRMMRGRSNEVNLVDEDDESPSTSAEDLSVDERQSLKSDPSTSPRRPLPQNVIFEFSSLEDMIQMTKMVSEVRVLPADLYHLSNKYLLVVHVDNQDMTEETLKHFVFKGLEFGTLYKFSEAYVIEHGETIRHDDTISYFSENF